MAYVPPALRRKKQEAGADCGTSDVGNKPASVAENMEAPTERLPRADDVHEYYWPPVELDAGEGMRSTVHSTLNSSTSEPDKLKYIMLFQEANPRWETDHLIYMSRRTCITSPEARSLPRKGRVEDSVEPAPPLSSDEPYSPTHTPDLTDYLLEPIAIFEQAGSRNGGFRFIGYHKIIRLQFLEPRSADLMRMLEQKFSVTNKFGRVSQQHRSPASWKASLEHRWAVMKLEKHEAADKSLPAPDVKVNDERERGNKQKKHASQKSVNELLKEMRLGKSETEAAAEEPQLLASE
ncbi:30s ribosomal protein s16 [Diplodia corticola]|uniref:30s ribosomal protein s16 n=1 Tax=Diplodia corticola TaxID=236234 RepID=A0A1J9SL10_9PEZI|nr:30s ribosomal protein s16 [Diplodia corticola]OJD40412.1 30s ribosomal protein s16 [Diplodia corticola]